MLIVPSINITI